MATIRLLQGDITEVEADAIVNAANTHLWMGAGVAGAIKRKGGAEIEQEAVRRGPIPVGTAIATTAGRLRARYVIHAAVMGPDLVTDAEKIRQATRSALQLADDLGLRSVALPALGTGVGRFPLDEAARIMLSAAKNFTPKTLQEILFVLYDTAAYQTFARVLAELEGRAPGASA